MPGMNGEEHLLKAGARRAALVALGLVAAAGFLSETARCDEPAASAPPGEPATTSAPATASAPSGYAPLPGAATVREGLAFSEEERQLLSAVRDRTSAADEQAVYMLYRRAASLPQLTEGQTRTLDRSSYANLLNNPGRYRGEPMLLAVRVMRVRQTKPGEGLSFSRWWPRDRSVWQIDALSADTASPVEQPLTIDCVADPAPALGKPAQVTAEGDRLYLGKPVSAVCVFYKVFTQKDRLGQPRDYPMAVAWQVAPGAGEPRPSAVNPLHVAGLALVLILLAAYVLLRRTTRRIAAGAGKTSDYRPLRDLETEAHEGKRRQPTEEDIAAIDEELKEAVEDFRKERRTKGDAEDD